MGGTVLVPGVHSILTQSTQHTEQFSNLRGCIVCVPRVCIMRAPNTQNTDRYNDPRGRYNICIRGIHYTDSESGSEYTEH